MSIDLASDGPPAGDVFMTVPEGWSVVNLDGLLGGALIDAAAAALGDEADPAELEQARVELEQIHRRVRAERVLFMAFRGRAEAMDVLTLALPGPPERGSETGDAPSRESAARSEERRELVELADREMIVHEQAPQQDDQWPTCVQAVALIPDSDRGVVLTLMSSDAQAGDVLRREVELLAGSLSSSPPSAVA